MAFHVAAAVVMGLLLLAVVLVIARGMDWRSNTVLTGRQERNVVEEAARNPMVWTVGFLVLALGTTAVAVLAVGDFGVAGMLPAAAAAFGLIVAIYLVVGTYAAARDRDVSAAGATLATSVLLGVLLLAAISARLLGAI